MATMKFKDLKNYELQNKIRSIKDLVNYVGKQPPSHPNYSIFLGAGASVTSGINSGGYLVEEWRKEIYEQYNKGGYLEGLKEQDNIYEEAKKRAIEYLIREHGVWYNPQNEYSSLFERKFDLPSQRRRFVENLVDEKLPSIGYLYLITLINNGYFNTIFTTNFDDLINEAFYQFSNTRPLICAHDSAVNSISVVSKRPKIVKLHGDYLFDDIKNTIKETESLEQNTKEKFIEFSKDNGLIIVGYSGQDRSILDVLNYLLQQEDYLKNGIYWCFRPDDEINHEVRKILWKDKVYCVEIDSFDELFTKFCNYIKIKPNLIDNSKDSKRERCIQKFIEDYQANPTSNFFVKEFIEEISTARNNQDISDLIRQLNQNKNVSMSSENFKKLLEVENLINKNQLDDALSMIDNRLNEEADEEVRESYIISKIKIYKIKNKKNEAINLINSLIEGDEFNIKYHLWKLGFLTNIQEKINYLVDLDRKIKFNFELKNSIIRTFIFYHKNYDDKIVFGFNDCERMIEESLTLDPSLDNDAYDLKVEFLRLRIQKDFPKEKNSSQNFEKEINLSIDKVISDILKINKNHNECINIRKKYVMEKSDVKLINEFIDDLNIVKLSSSKEKSKSINFVISDIYNDIVTMKDDDIKNKEFVDFEVIRKFFNDYKGDPLKIDNVKFLLERFVFSLAKDIEYDKNLIMDDLKYILGLPNSIDYIRSICNKFTLVSNPDINTLLKSFVDKNKIHISMSSYNFCMSEIESSNKDYGAALSLLDKYYQLESRESDDFISYIYALLLAKEYQRIDDFIFEHRQEIDLFSKKEKVIISINKLTAKKNKYGKLDQDDEKELQQIISKYSNDKRIFICANSLLDKNEIAKHHIKEVIRNDFKFYYELMEWPAINDALKLDIGVLFENFKSNKPNLKIA